MSILRFSSASLTLTVSVFALGFGLYSFAAKPVCPSPHPSCNDDGGGGGESMFSVLFEGEMDGSSGAANWLGGFLGKNSIGLNDAPPDPLDVGAITNLSILKDGGISEEHGNACFFESDSFPTGDYLIHQAFIKEGKGGRAESSIWLHGKTILGQEDILYVLKLYGQFDPEIAWPPVDEKTPHSIIFTDWELVIEGGGKNKNDSCSGDGETTVYVTVNVES